MKQNYLQVFPSGSDVAPNNSLNLTENGGTAPPRDLTAPRINVHRTRGGATLSDVHSAAG